jgi:hypothetical protein
MKPSTPGIENSEKERGMKDAAEWLSKHKDSDRLVFDEVTGFPIQAIYEFPLGNYMYKKLRGLSDEQ